MTDHATSTSVSLSGESSSGSSGGLGLAHLRAEDLFCLPGRRLAEVLAGGYPIDPEALAGTAYRGVSLGLPAFIERLTWKTFQKTFLRDPQTGELWGWNVRIEQRGVAAPSVAKHKGGRPWTFGQYVVRPGSAYQIPRPAPNALVIDYGPGGNGRLSALSRMRDPIVAVNPGSAELLLGWSYLDLFGLQIPTPSFFALTREGPISYVPARLAQGAGERTARPQLPR